METTKKVLLLFIVVLTINQSFGQEIKRKLNYRTYTTFIYAVPLETEVESITDMDLTLLLNEDKNANVEITIDENNELVITNYKLDIPQYYNHYQRSIEKTVNDINGSSVYNRNEKLVYSEDNYDPENYTVENNKIEKFGLSEVFETDLEIFRTVYNEIGYNTLIKDDGTFAAVSDTIEFYFDPNNYVYEFRTFQDEQFVSSSWFKFVKIDDLYVPSKTIHSNIDYLFSGTKYQELEVIIYAQYTITDENGNVIVDYTQEYNRNARKGDIRIKDLNKDVKKNVNLEIYPNPVENEILVSIPYFIASNINLEIYNSLGRLIFTDYNIESGSEQKINVSGLIPGIYILRVGKDNLWKTKKFIKK